MTLGEIRFRLAKLAPGLDPDLLDGWIGDRYSEILARLNWHRLRVDAVLQTVAPYATGSVAVTSGSADVLLSGGTWSNALNGRAFRVEGDAAWYQFARTGDTSGTLDRAYEGASNTAAVYSLFQSVYPLPPDCRMVESMLSPDTGPLERRSSGQLNHSAAGRPVTGRPRLWTPYMDDASDPPQLQIDLYPIPDAVYGLPYIYFAEQVAPTETGKTLLPWLQPGALIEGVTANIKRHLKDYAAAREHAGEFERLTSLMVRGEARSTPSVQIRMEPRFTRHYLQRAIRTNPRSGGPRMP